MNKKKIKLVFLLISLAFAIIYFVLIGVFIFQKVNIDDEGAIFGIFFYSYIGFLILLLPSSLMYITYGIVGQKQIKNPHNQYIVDAEILLISLIILSPYYSISFYFTDKWIDGFLYFKERRKSNYEEK